MLLGGMRNSRVRHGYRTAIATPVHLDVQAQDGLLGRPQFLADYVAEAQREHALCDGRRPRARSARAAALGSSAARPTRSQSQRGATALVFRDPGAGEEFDGALAAAEDRANAEAQRASAAEKRVRALEKELRKLATHSHSPEREP